MSLKNEKIDDQKLTSSGFEEVKQDKYDMSADDSIKKPLRIGKMTLL